MSMMLHIANLIIYLLYDSKFPRSTAIYHMKCHHIFMETYFTDYSKENHFQMLRILTQIEYL